MRAIWRCLGGEAGSRHRARIGGQGWILRDQRGRFARRVGIGQRGGVRGMASRGGG